jgi:membrane protease YdiL (CAAX protease family)
MRLNNAGMVQAVVLETVTLGLVLWVGRIRGWSLTTFGFRLSWKEVGAGALLFLASFFLVQPVLGLITREVFHTTVDFHRVSEVTMPFVIMICVVNPVFEESMEAGYIFNALQRTGMWPTILVSATFRGLLHATMGVSGFVFMSAQGLLYGLVYWRYRQLWPLIIAHSLQMLYSLLPPALSRP